MPKPVAYITVNGQVVKLTYKVTEHLCRRARQHGYYDRGHDHVANATVVEVACPACRETVRGYVSPFGSRRTPAVALDGAMIEHLAYDCSEVTRP